MNISRDRRKVINIVALALTVILLGGCASVLKSTDRCTSGLYSEASVTNFLFSTVFLPLTPVCIAAQSVASSTTAEERAAIVGAAAAAGTAPGATRGGEEAARRNAAFYAAARNMAERDAQMSRSGESHAERARVEKIGCSINAVATEFDAIEATLSSTWTIQPETKRCTNGCSGTLTYELDVLSDDGVRRTADATGILVWESDRGESVEVVHQVMHPSCARGSIRTKECKVVSARRRAHTCTPDG